MSAEVSTEPSTDDSTFGRSVALGAAIGIPVAFVLITLAVWLMLDVGLGEAVAISVWPSLLTGGFGGGFIGVVRAAKK